MASRSLGTLTLDLVLKMGGFQQGLDKSARELDKRSREMSSRAKKLGTDIGIGLSAIGGVAVAGLTKYIANTIEAEKVQAQLAARIKDTGAAAGRSLQQLSEQADKLQGLTIFDDEAIGEAQAMLLTFKEIQGVVFDETIASALDLATVMGTDAASAAKILGKALSDPEKGLSALRKAGILFTDAERERIKTMQEAGDMAGAQTEILKKLEGSMGTAAEAARNTLGGALQGLRNNFDNLLEGDTSGSGLKGTVEAINDLSDSLNDPQLKDGIDTVAGGILQIGSAAIQAISNVGKFSSNLNSIFANAGLAPGEELNQLEARRKAIAERGAESIIGRLFPERVKEELDRLDKEIAAYPFRNVVSSVSRAAAERAGGEGSGGSPGSGAAKTPKVRELPDFADEDRRALEAMVTEVSRANEMFDSLAATMAGPLAEAELQHKQNLVEIAELGRVAGKSSEEVAALKAEEVDRYNEQTDAIRAQLTPYQELIEGVKEETEYLKANTAEQLRLTAARLAGKGATDQQIEEVRKLLEVRDEFAAQSAYFEEVGDSFGDAFYDLATGAKEAEDALGSLLDSLFKESIDSLADFLSESVSDFLKSFKGTGSSGQGGWGDFFSALGGIFGGGRAGGGGVQPYSAVRVNEVGFEMATVNGNDYMLTGSQPVHVTPSNQIGGAGMTNNFYYAAPPDPRTQQQTAQRVGFEVQRAESRNR